MRVESHGRTSSETPQKKSGRPGKTWPVARRVTEEGAYSSLVALDDGTILCGLRSAVCRFNMAWLEQRQ